MKWKNEDSTSETILIHQNYDKPSNRKCEHIMTKKEKQDTVISMCSSVLAFVIGFVTYIPQNVSLENVFYKQMYHFSSLCMYVPLIAGKNSKIKFLEGLY